MKIELLEISIAELVQAYAETSEGGVVGYGGSLNIRPAYQREFVYNPKQRDDVINSVLSGFPLNVMYWVRNQEGGYEVLDGQQRTISIGRYTSGKFHVEELYFSNQPDDVQERILNYPLTIYVCEGLHSEILDWFRIINIAGEKLYEQELRNAIYSGPWVSDAKRYFSRNGCAAYDIGRDYVRGTAIRQDYLKTAIEWISEGEIEGYMAKHQSNPNAVSLWNYFHSVISWVKATFTEYRPQMKGVKWGPLYDSYEDLNLDPVDIEDRTRQLMMDDDVDSKSGVYSYLLDGDERHLNIRKFTDAMKIEAYERQKGICAICNAKFELKNMEGDHIDPWSKGGKSIAENCQMLCKPCNRRKSDK